MSIRARNKRVMRDKYRHHCFYHGHKWRVGVAYRCKLVRGDITPGTARDRRQGLRSEGRAR